MIPQPSLEDPVNISLTPELEAYVHNKVRSGRYLSASEVVRDALRALEERDRQRELKLAALRDSVAAGLDQLDQNDTWDLPEDLDEAVEDIKTRGQDRLRHRMGTNS